MAKRIRLFPLSGVALIFGGCAQTIVDRADRSVYRLIEERQKAAVGIVSDVHVGEEDVRLSQNSSMYQFVPRPVGAEIPPEFQHSAMPAAPQDEQSSSSENADPAPVDALRSPSKETVAESATDAAASSNPQEPVPTQSREISPQIYPESVRSSVIRMRLADALAYAMQRGREVQSAKEDLYLAALDLTLERHLWTPQFVGTIQTDYANYGQVDNFDQAMSAVSNFAVSQRLPFGGDVTARVVNSLMHDLTNHATSGESGTFILEANLPLLRGAGRAAYESRYTAERELIYAVRSYEHFRRDFAVRVSAGYFELQQSRAAIVNAYKSYKARSDDLKKVEFEDRVGRARSVFDVTRARSTFRSAEADLVETKEQYASLLDQFKILLGMPVDTPLDVVDQEDDQESAAFEALVPAVDEETAVSVALKYRLDLINSLDGVDDAQRGVSVARNRILPDLELTGSAGMDTDPDRLNSTSYNTERTTWRAGAELRIDDRKTERNAYRAAIIDFRRAQRDNDVLTDRVRAQVRRALRRIDQQKNLVLIQELNVEENRRRREAAEAQYKLGMINNRDVVEADDDLLEARNRYSAAVSDYRNAILAFRRDTATLRVDDNGRWDSLPEGDPTRWNDIR